MTIFIIIVGISLIAAGIYGVVSSRVESRDYKNSTDIQKISSVIIDFLTSNSKDDSGDVKYTTYKFKVSYVIDGKTYKGKCEERVWSSDYSKKYAYDKLRKGDTIDVEIYKTSKGEYKISPREVPSIFFSIVRQFPAVYFGCYNDMRRCKRQTEKEK